MIYGGTVQINGIPSRRKPTAETDSHTGLIAQACDQQRAERVSMLAGRTLHIRSGRHGKPRANGRRWKQNLSIVPEDGSRFDQSEPVKCTGV